MNNIKIKYLVYMWIFCAGIFLPLQSTFINAFKLPNVLQPIYAFLISGCIIALFINKQKILKLLDKHFIILFLCLIIAYVISIVINYDDISDRGMRFVYYTRNYSNFWSRPTVAPLSWGIMNPIFYLLFACLLTIFLKFKHSIKILLRILIIMAIISSVYSVYQIIADNLGLPFGSIFSGHSNEPIYLIKGIRRVEGIFFEAGPHATFLSPIFSVLFFQLFEKDTQQLLLSKKSILISLFPITYALIFTFSPIAYLTLIIVPISAFLINIKKIHISKKIMYRFILVISILFVIITIKFLPEENTNFDIISYMTDKIAISTVSASDPFIYLNPDSRSVRNYVGVQLFKEHPIFGAGPSSGIYYFFKYANFAYKKQLPGTSAILNTHLQNLSEIGLFGFIFYLLIILYPIIYYVKTPKKNNLINQGLLIGYILYLSLSFQAGPKLYTPYFWIIYMLLLNSINEHNNKRNYV